MTRTHGLTRYSDGCRCRTCTDANTNYMRERKRQIRTGQRQVPDSAHGLPSTYSNWLCRCVPCTDAERQRNLAKAQRRKASA